MEKALPDYFYISQDGDIKLYSKKDAPFLIEAANFHIDRRNGRPIDCPFTVPDLDAFIYNCMDEYFLNGVSDNLLNLLNENQQSVRYQCLVEKSKNNLFAVYVAHLTFNPPPIVFAACMFSNIASLGGLEGLKRCQSPKCQKFFIGRSNVKWCSKACGSKYRVKKMRSKKGR
ncbi:MAG: CGNR zinc finger domain-containing protein [Proteobacteria bacterium]|nr:CGNR zinc finger domain-containing protein [Pseudomonadota bacterium]